MKTRLLTYTIRYYLAEEYEPCPSYWDLRYIDLKRHCECYGFYGSTRMDEWFELQVDLRQIGTQSEFPYEGFKCLQLSPYYDTTKPFPFIARRLYR